MGAHTQILGERSDTMVAAPVVPEASRYSSVLATVFPCTEARGAGGNESRTERMGNSKDDLRSKNKNMLFKEKNFFFPAKSYFYSGDVFLFIWIPKR